MKRIGLLGGMSRTPRSSTAASASESRITLRLGSPEDEGLLDE